MIRITMQTQWATGLVLLLVATTIRAEDALPSGAAVLDRFVVKSGGKEAYRRIHNRMRKMRATNPDGEVSVTVYQAPPNLRLVESHTPRGFARTGTNGQVVWRDGFMDTHIFPEKRRDQELLEAFFHMPLKWREVFREVQCTEIVDLKGTRCHKLQVTPKSGMALAYFFAVDTGLQRAMERTVSTPLGDVNVRMYMEDYKPVDGILYPHRLEQEVRGQKNSVITVESIVHNLEMPKDKFELPKDVKEMLEGG